MRLPERINLSIGHGCFVSCPGCYAFFGARPARLPQIAASMARFVETGTECVTISGGDPLLISGLGEFIDLLRHAGVRTIKVDTVGTPWVDPLSAARSVLPLEDLLAIIDVLAIPLDGWSNESAQIFRRGRPRLFDETCLLLRMLEAGTGRARLFVNTVLHRLNVAHLPTLWKVLNQYGAIAHWNVFQYTPTDQASHDTNESFSLTTLEFNAARDSLLAQIGPSPCFEVEFASTSDRVGRYLLINSDGEAWLPDRMGRTLALGRIFGREDDVLRAWSDAVDRMGVDAEDHRQRDSRASLIVL